MSDDERPDNVVSLPRIGSPPPPSVPSAPVLTGSGDAVPDERGHVRMSAFDAPEVPHAPRSPDAVPAALRSNGLDGHSAPDAGPPRTGALSLAAILAIALAAFEGLHTWVQESGPRRAEAAAHQRELELLAAKAGADAVRHAAEVDAHRAKATRGGRLQSSHEYGRGALGRGSGGSGRAWGGTGPGSPRKGGSGPYNGSAQGRGSAGFQNRSGNVNGSGGRFLRDRNGSGSSANGGNLGRGGSPRPGSFGGSTGAGRGSGGSGGSGSSGRRSAWQAVSDWWGKGRNNNGAGSKGTGSGSGAKGPADTSGGRAADTKARIRDAVKNQRSGPTFWEKAGDRLHDRWKARQADTRADTQGPGSDKSRRHKRADNDAWKPPGDRVRFRQAVYDAVNDRWEKRRERWKARGGPRSRTAGGTRKKPTGPGRAGPGPSASPGTGPDAGGFGPRTSAFDAGPEPAVTITVEQVDPPGAHAKRWEPTAIAAGKRQLPRQSAPALPRAPQRPAGQRPGTTRRKDPVPMPAASPHSGAPALVKATVPAPGGMSARHATDIRLDDTLKALTMLTTAGMETHDECAELARQAQRLLDELEAMAHDLAETHNVNGPKTMGAVAALMESVGNLIVQAKRMAKACLVAAELSEAEELAMARDHRPMQAAYIDAGVAGPSARIHNEN
ncbi:hypothetical protein ACIQ9J_35155 [Streptomyces sp. NPDC094153]|uniref:hypothetical protein n=1 Tax=Streptomyces sp. NPDC094153 TaxID=3366058 RepID=UPI00381CAE5D